MTAKRFTYDYEDDKYYDKGFFKDNGKELYKDELLGLLNTLYEENEQLKKRIDRIDIILDDLNGAEYISRDDAIKALNKIDKVVR